MRRRGYMWDVRLELASVRLVEEKKRKNKADLALTPNMRREGEGCASASRLFLGFSSFLRFRPAFEENFRPAGEENVKL